VAALRRSITRTMVDTAIVPATASANDVVIRARIDGIAAYALIT
jgi:hypothetical protein